MNPLIPSQVFDVFVMFYAGMTVMFFYQILEGYKKRRKTTKMFMKATLEIIFWIFAAFITCAFLYYCCYGELSVHSFVALFSGMCLWRFCVGKKISIFIGQLYGIIKSKAKI